ncbi:MAG: DUF4870 domain-containing protein [Gammaproteobacteria bacterium]|nr:DUF4870 domain-containing protein [Gammaproteobacteria bacterium]
MNDPSGTAASPGTPTENERTWGMLAHLAALAGLVFPLIGNILGPLFISIARGDRSPFVATHAKEALNFNITVTLAAVVSALLMLVFVGFLLLCALFILWLVMTLVAAIRASEGAAYRYPIALRLLH